MTGSFLFLLAALATPPQDDREVARWALSVGAKVQLPKATLGVFDEIPAGPVHVTGLDFLGTLIEPNDLARLAKMRTLKSLKLPAYMWNGGAGVEGESNDAFAHLASLTSLESLVLSIHFLTELSVKDAGMEALGSLHNLKELRLVQGLLTGKGLAKLTGLQRIDLTDSRITDEGLQSLAAMPNLQRIILRNTLVTDAGLAHLAKLRNVVELDLFGCKITDAGIDHLQQMRGMQQLNLLGANLTDKGLQKLRHMRDLRVLTLYRNPISNAGIKELSRLKRLRFVDLRYTRTTRSGIELLGKALPALSVQFVDTSGGSSTTGLVASAPKGKTLQALESWLNALGGTVTTDGARGLAVSFAGTPVSDAHMAALAAFTDIERLDISATEVSDLGLQALAALPRLSDLTLNGLRVSDQGLLPLAKVPLQRLAAAHTALTGRNLKPFAGLVDLNLSDSEIDEEGARQVAALPALARLDVSFTSLGDSAVAKIAEARTLRWLSLRTTAITAQVLVAVATLKQLESLDVSYTSLSDDALTRLAPLTALKDLRLVRTGVGKAALRTVSSFAGLQHLALSSTSVDGAMLSSLAPLHALQHLELEGTLVGDDAVETLRTMSGLKTINLLHTRLSPDAHSRLKTALPACEILWDARFTAK